MKLWFQIAEDLGLARCRESDLHPHAAEERAELFHTADPGSTEYEYLNLLHALVLATKPAVLLETGTFAGLGTLALASAVQFNGVGSLVTVDAGECPQARQLVKSYGLESCVKILQSDSVRFCAEWQGEAFDFMFFDSDVTVRHRECDMLIQRRKVSPGALAVFHDSSSVRFGVRYSWEMDQYLRAFPGGLNLKLSRGLRIVQF